MRDIFRNRVYTGDVIACINTMDFGYVIGMDFKKNYNPMYVMGDVEPRYATGRSECTLLKVIPFSDKGNISMHTYREIRQYDAFLLIPKDERSELIINTISNIENLLHYGKNI